MRNLLCFVVLAVASTLSTHASAALPVLHEEDFEGCTGTGYALQSGAFGGTVDDGIECGTDDGGARDFTFPFGAGNNVSGQSGTDYIALEEPVGAGLANPNAVVLSPVSITGATSLQLSFLFGAPWPSAGRYEATDTMQLQYKIDSGSYITVGSFAGSGGGTGMAEDDNLDGSFTVPVSGLVMQRFTYNLNNRAGQGTVSGSSITIRALFSSDGAQEEMVFDDIVLRGIAGVAAPVVDLSAATYSIGEDGTPVGAQVTLTRSVSTAGAASIDLVFSSGSATGDVDFDAAPISVTFAAGVTTALVNLPIEEDALDESNETFTIGLLADGTGATAGTLNSAVVTIVDNDTADIDVSKTAVSVSEAGTTDSYTVVLESEPTHNVQIDISTSGQVLLASGGGQAASSLQLTFTPGNWFTAKTVTVSAINDNVVEANPHSATLTLVVSSTDPKYNNFSLNSIGASVAENDFCGDTACNPSESTATCPGDCGTLCGDAACNGSESTINCVADCGSSCGDGAVNGNEVCDGNNLGGLTCFSQGYDLGVLTCAGDCLSVNTGACQMAVLPDAGSDGGSDSGTSDSGTSDSGTSDSGTSDSGTSDSGTSDSGTSDSGTSDSGTSDSGISDSGTSATATTAAASTAAASTAAATTAVVEEDSGGPNGGTPDTGTPGGGTQDSATSSAASSSSGTPGNGGPGGDTPDSGDGGADSGLDGATDSSGPTTTTPDSGSGGDSLDSGETPDSAAPPATSSSTTSPNAEPDAAEPSLTASASASGATPSASHTATAPRPSSSIKPLPSSSVSDAGAGDAGILDGGPGDDGCDCRVAAHSRSDGARLFGLALLGLVLGRLRRRRNAAKNVN